MNFPAPRPTKPGASGSNPLGRTPDSLERLARRFWRKVDRSAGEDACWTWTGSTDPRGGYGHVQVGSRTGVGMARRPRQAHRVSWWLTYGAGDLDAVPEIRHRCNNPPCVRPDHLLPGTHAENMRDMVEVGHSTKGETNPGAVLSDSAVIALRERRAAGETVVSLATTYRVSDSLVTQICTGKLWRHIGGPIVKARVYRRRAPSTATASQIGGAS